MLYSVLFTYFPRVLMQCIALKCTIIDLGHGTDRQTDREITAMLDVRSRGHCIKEVVDMFWYFPW